MTTPNHLSVPFHGTSNREPEYGQGDVRAFWGAAAMALLAVLAVVAFKMNGAEIRAALRLAPAPTAVQQVSKSSLDGRGASPELPVSAQPGTVSPQ